MPSGTACECTPYPQLSGADIVRIAAHPVAVRNDAVPGDESGDVVHQLQHDSNFAGHVEGSQVVLVEIGANDVSYSSSCGTTVACYDEKLPDITDNLDTIVERIHALGHGSELDVVLLDYWSVWLGGQDAQARGAAYVAAAGAVTAHVDDAIRSVARATGSIYVDLRTAFRGPDRSWDETHFLAPDGDHPNDVGHQRIAQAIAYTIMA